MVGAAFDGTIAQPGRSRSVTPRRVSFPQPAQCSGARYEIDCRPAGHLATGAAAGSVRERGMGLGRGAREPSPLSHGWGSLRGRGFALPIQGESVERGGLPPFHQPFRPVDPDGLAPAPSQERQATEAACRSSAVTSRIRHRLGSAPDRCPPFIAQPAGRTGWMGLRVREETAGGFARLPSCHQQRPAGLS